MAGFRKILVFFFAALFGMILIALFAVYLRKDYLFAKLMRAANGKIQSYGYTLKYDDADIVIFPPRLSLTGIRVLEGDGERAVLEAKRSYLSIRPLNLLIPGASPFSIYVEQFHGRVGEKLLAIISNPPQKPEKKKSDKSLIPTLALKDGILELLDPWKFISEAKLSVKTLFFSGSIWEGLGVIYSTKEEGITAVVKHGSGEFPLNITALHVNSHIQKNNIEIKKFSLSSPVGNISLKGLYELDKEALLGEITGDVTPSAVARQFRIGALENLFDTGKIAFSGRAVLTRDRVRFNVNTELLRLLVKGIELNGTARCDYENGVVSLKKLALDTPAGSVDGDVSYDLSAAKGEGKFSIQEFSPGRLAEFLLEKPVIGARGTGNGYVTFASPERGKVILSSALQMERGFTLVFKNMNEEVAWAEPVELGIEAFLTDIFHNPEISVRRFVIADSENQISLKGNFHLKKRDVSIRADADITRVKSLGLKGIFARSGAIRGNFLISGSIDSPLVESSFTLNDISLSGLPPGNVFIKGSGILGGNVSLIADYVSRIGNVTFSGTYFPDTELYFIGSLTAEDVDVGSFSSENLLTEALYRDLEGRFPLLFPVTGTLSFDGDLVLGKDKIRANGILHSDVIRSPKLELLHVSGDVDYNDGILKIEDISFTTFGGQTRAKGLIGKDRFELLGNFSNIDPDAIDHLISDDRDILTGESLEGAFDVILDAGGVDKLNIHLTSDKITVRGSDLTGIILDGKKKGDILSFTLSTSNELVNLEVNHDLKDSRILCKIDFLNFPLKITEKSLDMRLGFFGVTLSGSGIIEIGNISNLRGPLSAFPFKADSLDIDMKAVPYFTSYGKSLPEFSIKGTKKEKRILLDVTSPKSEGGVLVTLTQRQKEELFVNIRGEINSGTVPIVLPSKVLGKVNTDLLIDFSGPFFSLPDRGSGRFVLTNVNLEFLDEKILGENIVALFKDGDLTIEKSSIYANQKLFSLSGRAGLDGQIDIFLSGEYDAGLVNAVVKGVFEKITGKVVGNIQITGKLPDIEVSGQGSGEDIFIKFVGFKHPFENMTTNLSFFKDSILFDSISGNLGGGDLEGSGEVSILKDAPVNLSFNADFYGVSLSYPEELPSKLEGSIELLGPVDNLFLRGEIFVDKALYNTPMYPEKFIVDLKKNIAKFNAPVGRMFAINLDIECVSDGTIIIKNNIAGATAGGTFRLLGDTSRPIIIGTFETIEGEVEFRGTNYTVERLLVDFDDPLSNNPKIDAFAKAEKGDYTIFVEVTGKLDNYSVELFSEPPLSKTDIVSLLSLGVTTEAYAEDGSSVTTAGLATVALAPLKTQIEEGIRTFTGFERFAVESNYSSVTGIVEPTVVIGKTVGDRLSLDFSTSLVGTGTTNVVGEFRLVKDLYFRGDWTGGGTADEGDIGGELRVKKRFHDFSDFIEKLFGEEEW